MTLKAALFDQARHDAGLAALLASGSPSIFRWYDTQLPQKGAKFPAITVTQTSNPAEYVAGGRMPTSYVSVLFRIYGTGNDSQNADAVATALAAFLDTFNGSGIEGLAAYSNHITSDRDGGIAQTDPLTYQRLIGARIFWNSTL